MIRTTYCAYCIYRRAAGILRIDHSSGALREPACYSCAQEAHHRYGRRARLTTWPTR